MQTSTDISNVETKKMSQRALAVVTGALVFQAIFWKEKMAANTVGYFAFIVFSFFMLYHSVTQVKRLCWLFAASLITLAAVIIHNTLLSKIAFSSSLLLLVVFFTNAYRSLHYAALALASRIVFCIPQFFTDWLAMLSRKKDNTRKKNNLRMLFFPILLAIVFLGIYLMASNILADIAGSISLFVSGWFSHLFVWVSFPRFFFFIMGLAITAMLLIKQASKAEAKEQTETDGLLRKRMAADKSGVWNDIKLFVLGKSANGMLALKLEYKAAVVSLILLNGLLLLLNYTDIVYVWFSRIYKPGFEWVQFVHHGADILVYSILLAIAVVLFFFRGSINFLQKNKFIKQLAYAWIFQNMILAISVCIRNYYYVTHMGFAYKRIGLFLFAALVMVGLVTVFIKISKLKTVYYLLRVNGWAAFAILVLSATINWDVWIAEYNLARKDSIPVDVAFLLTLNDKAIPVLDKYSAFLATPQTDLQRQYYRDYDRGFQTTNLDNKKQQFLQEQAHYTWLSWNYADSYVADYLKGQKIK